MAAAKDRKAAVIVRCALHPFLKSRPVGFGEPFRVIIPLRIELDPFTVKGMGDLMCDRIADPRKVFDRIRIQSKKRWIQECGGHEKGVVTRVVGGIHHLRRQQGIAAGFGGVCEPYTDRLRLDRFEIDRSVQQRFADERGVLFYGLLRYIRTDITDDPAQLFRQCSLSLIGKPICAVDHSCIFVNDVMADPLDRFTNFLILILFRIQRTDLIFKQRPGFGKRELLRLLLRAIRKRIKGRRQLLPVVLQKCADRAILPDL